MGGLSRPATRTPEEAPLSTDQTRTTLLAFVAAVGTGTPLEPHLAADATFTALVTGQVIRGRAAIADFVRTFSGGAFATHCRVNLAIFDNGGRLVIDLNLTGTHVGEFRGIP